jgi:outer membrane protein TolC
LIDTALQNNQELQITLQEIEIAKNDARIRKVLLPTVGLRAGSGRKVGGTLVKVLGMLLPKLRQENFLIH